MHRLPTRIAAVMIGTLLLFVLTVGFSVLWLTRALDDQDLGTSRRLAEAATAGTLDELSRIGVDYSKWDDAAVAVERGDKGWIYDNLGSSATTAAVANLVVLWGGPLPSGLGWTDDGVEDGRPDLVGERLLALADERLRAVPVGEATAPTFFDWQAGDLFAVAASRIERSQGSEGAEADDGRIARLLVGRRIDDSMIRRYGTALLATGVRVDRAAPADRPSVPLPGGDGAPVAFLSWMPAQPGTAVLLRMTPPLLLILASTVALAAFGILLARRTAHGLVLAERESASAARTDGLTGLPNRAAFRAALAAPARAGERAILFLDVNGFKRVNDSIGHAAGDQVIAQLARRLAPLAQRGRLLARIGGDEFVVLITGPDAGARAEEVAREVEEAMAGPFDALGHQLRLAAAVGHAVQATDDMAGDDLLRQADLAMYEAKRRGDRGPVGFDDLIETTVQDARAVERALRAALDRGGEFSIDYQPIAGPEGALAHVEALARWTSPELGTVPPDRFIAVAERSGLILRLGRVLLRLVRDDLAAHPDLRVSLNISPLQLMAPSFVQDLLADLAERGVDPARIEVELTEAVVVDDPALAADRLRELHDAGFSTALDDFGTGYSSIGYLQQMGFDTLKIDRSFVSGCCEAPNRLALVKAMILLAHALGLRVACEGVETAQELRTLRELGCDLAQGYHLDRPMPIDRIMALWRPQGKSAVA